MDAALPKSNIGPSLLAIIIDSMGFGLGYPILTALFSPSSQHSLLHPDASIAVRNFYLGLSFLLYPLCMFFGASILGELSDRWGRKKVLTICTTGLGLSFFCMGIGVVFNSLFLVLFGRALSGLMAGSQPIAQAAISDVSTIESKPRNMSLLTLALSFGIIAGPTLGGVLSDSAVLSFFSFSVPFFFVAALSWICTIWIASKFKETYLHRTDKPFNFLRPVQIFIEAFKDKAVRLLAVVFLLMQIGFSLYFQLILVLLAEKYHYTSWKLGLFNGFIGVCFVFALYITRRLTARPRSIEWIAFWTLLITGISQLGASFARDQLSQWVFVIPVATADMVAYTAMLTSFSNAASKDAQGWVMGIAGAVMALSWTFTGFSLNLTTVIGIENLILIGALFLIASAFFMMHSCKSHWNGNGSVRAEK